MKVNGKEISGPKIITVVIPAGDDFVEFRFRCLTEKDDFSAVVPPPVPPTVIRPGKGRMNNFEDPAFKASLKAWEVQEFHHKILKSMDATEGLIWTTVDMTDPSTYDKWSKEVNESFGRNVADVLYVKYREANILDEGMLEEARKSFLLLQESEQKASTSLLSAALTTPSGEPAKDSGMTP